MERIVGLSSRVIQILAGGPAQLGRRIRRSLQSGQNVPPGPPRFDLRKALSARWPPSWSRGGQIETTGDGDTSISDARNAAEALRPLAGDGAYWLFSLGLIGAGMLGVPVLAGSYAYAIAEAAGWVGSLDIHPPPLILVVLLTSSTDVMGEHRNGPVLRWLGWTCATVMLIAAVIMFVTAFVTCCQAGQVLPGTTTAAPPVASA